MQKRDARIYFFISAALHVVVLMVFVLSFEMSGKMPVVENTANDMKIVTATVMDSSTLTPLPKPLPKPQPPVPPPPQPVAKPVVEPKPQPPKVVEKKPEVVEKKPVEVAVKPKAIVIPDKQKKINKDDIAKKLLADMKQQVDKQKKLKQKAIEEAFAKEMKQQAQKSLQQQLLNEQKKLTDARASQSRGEVNKFKALILQAISQQWLIPANVEKNLYSELLIRVAPGGVVLDVQIIKSSGNPALDRSARAAVFKASPLPVPKEADAFEAFRQFVLKVKPENVLNKDSWV